MDIPRMISLVFSISLLVLFPQQGASASEAAGNSQCIDALGRELLEMRDLDAQFSQAQAALKSPLSEKESAEKLELIARIQKAKGDFHGAEISLESAKTHAFSMPCLLARIYTTQAPLLASRGELDDAVKLFDEVERIWKENDVIDMRWGDLWQSQGKLQYFKGNYKKAEVLFSKSLAKYEELRYARPDEPSVAVIGYPDLSDVAKVASHLGAVYYALGDFDSSELSLLKAYQSWALIDNKDTSDYAATLQSLGELYLAQGHISQALQHFEGARKIIQEMKAVPPLQLADVLNGIGLVYIEQNQLDVAGRVLNQALRILNSASESHQRPNLVKKSVANVNEAYARLQEKQGAMRQAESLWSQTLAYKEQALPSQHIELAFAKHDIGNFYGRKGEYQKAKQYLDSAQSSFSENLGENNRKTLFNNLAYNAYSQATKDPQKILHIPRPEESIRNVGTSPKRSKLTWNFWATSSDGTAPQKTVNAGAVSIAHLILSSRELRYENTKIIDVPAVRAGIEQVKSGQVKIEVQLLADQDRIPWIERPVQAKDINFDQANTQDGNLAEWNFKFRPSQKEGDVDLTFTVWVDGRPVDDLTVTVCVRRIKGSGSCTDSTVISHGFMPSNALVSQLGAPSASLLFIEHHDPRTGTWGVFRIKGEKQLFSWKTKFSSAELIQLLDRIGKTFGEQRIINDDTIRSDGSNLYAMLFDSSNEKLDNPKEAFQAFVQKVSKKGGNATLFVRGPTATRNLNLSLPIGLFPIQWNGKDDFLGFHFVIEHPLPAPAKKHATTACLSKWFFALPTNEGDGVVKKAIAKSNTFVQWASNKNEFAQFQRFTEWIETDEELDSNAILAILAHHDQGELYYDLSAGNGINAYRIHRQFRTPSIAILNACGTGGLSAMPFISKLSSKGVQSVVATSANVDPELAGEFLECFASQLPRDKSISISSAYLKTLACLRDKKIDPSIPQSRTYGAQALLYMLLGNGDIPVCTPTEAK